MSPDSPTDNEIPADALSDTAGANVMPADAVPPDAPTKQWWRRTLLQFRLWMLLLLFIPAAYFAKSYVPAKLGVSYYEEKEDFWQAGMQELDFSSNPNGAPNAQALDVGPVYQSMGITFAFGTPDRIPGTDLDVGEVNATFVEKLNASSPNYRDPGPPFQQSNNPKLAGQVSVGKVKGPGYIGISGYPFRSTFAPYRSSIACFSTGGKYTQRFKGAMTIRFHQPGDPKGQAGVYRVGFYAGLLSQSEAIRVSLYGLDGKLLCRQSNIQDRQFAFMGFRCTRKISRIEIETIGMDKDYAVSGLMFDEVDLGLSGMAE